MSQRSTVVLVGTIHMAVASCLPAHATDKAKAQPHAAVISRLVAAYPTFIERADGNALVWTDGTRMTIDDSKAGKSFEALLDAADIKDMFYAPYPPGAMSAPPQINVDPGRVRNEALFRKMYGDCSKGETQKTLVEIIWLPKKWGKTLSVTRVNGVAEKLSTISRELDELPARLDDYLRPAAGTFNCRVIAGTERSSTHGLGIAIDIATKHAHYWRWTEPDASGRYAYRNLIPPEVVEVFEKHGFIWGGKWYHFDTMHFEYRPELIAPR